MSVEALIEGRCHIDVVVQVVLCNRKDGHFLPAAIIFGNCKGVANLQIQHIRQLLREDNTIITQRISLRISCPASQMNKIREEGRVLRHEEVSVLGSSAVLHCLRYLIIRHEFLHGSRSGEHFREGRLRLFRIQTQIELIRVHRCVLRIYNLGDRIS